jgi:adenylate cyclase
VAKRRLWRLRGTIAGGFVGLLVATVVAIGAMAYVETKRGVEDLVAQNLHIVAQHADGEVQRLLQPAHPILEEAVLLEQRALMPDDPREAGVLFVERMRYQPQLGWLGYADRAERSFTGGTRAPDGSLRYNRSVNGGVPIEATIAPDGTWTEVAPTTPRPYDPTTRPWFRASLRHPGLLWHEPYAFSSGAWGISATRAVEQGGEVVGVLLADFFLDDLTRFLGRLRVAQSGRVVLLTRGGIVLGSDDPELETVLARHGGETHVFLRGVEHRVARTPLTGGGLDWEVAILVPEHELTGIVWENARTTAITGLLALLVAVLAATWFANRIARPIRQMASDVERISRLEITEQPSPQSSIQEIAVMGQAVDAMKAGLSSFQRYVPVDLVRQVLASGVQARLYAKPTELTVLFSDIEGFTTIAETTPPDVVIAALGEYLEAMSDVIEANGGSMLQFLGDGLFAVWGAPEPDADHAKRALDAAIAMRDRANELAERAERSGKPVFRTRIGVNSGVALVGNIGAPGRFNFTGVGDAVNTAARIEGLNKEYGTQVLVGARTAELAGRSGLSPVDVVRMKGKTRPVRVFAPDGVPEAVIARYLARDFDGALAALAKLEGPVARVLAERCRRYLAEPPEPDWDGTWVMSTK